MARTKIAENAIAEEYKKYMLVKMFDELLNTAN